MQNESILTIKSFSPGTGDSCLGSFLKSINILTANAESIKPST